MSQSRTEVLELIAANDKEKVNDYFNNLLEKSKTATKQIEATILYMLLCVLLYYTLANVQETAVSLGPLSLSNKDIIIKLIPMVFSFLMLRLILQNDTGNQIQKVLTLLAHKIYNYEYSETDELTNNATPLIRILLPSLFWIEMRSYLKPTPSNTTLIIIALIPYFIIAILLPYIFEISVLITIYRDYFSDWTGKFSFFTGLYFMIGTFIFQFGKSKTI